MLDLWRLSTPLFHHVGPIAMFAWQHGPHRQGIGEWILCITLAATGWNVHTVCLVQAGLVSAACAAMLWLKRRAWGPLTYTDVAIPLLFLTLAQWETIVGIPNPGYVAVPLLLAPLYCAVWLVPRPAIRYAAAICATAVAAYCGMGLFLAALTAPILLADAWRLRRDPRARGAAVAAAVCAASALALFFVGYRFSSAVPDRNAWHPGAANYVKFMAVMLATPLLGGPAPQNSAWSGPQLHAAMLVGILLLAALIAVAYRSAARYLRTGEDTTRSIAILALYTLLYCAFAAYGRATIGTFYAQASRYTTGVVPGLTALYLTGLSLSPGPRRVWTLAAAAIALVTVGPVTPFDRYWMHRQYQQKSAWRMAWMRTGDIQASNRAAGTAIDTDPDEPLMRAKLAYLRQHGYNLYSRQ